MAAAMSPSTEVPPPLTGEYAARGEYHRVLDPEWAYYPTYVAKMTAVRRWVARLPREAAILDAGCGEGVLVEEFVAAGRSVVGLDLNFESPHVRRGSLLAMPFADESFDAVLCLDALEHLPLPDQRPALRELRRVLRRQGKLLISVPNLGHLANRLRFLFHGHLRRTAKESKHPGDRTLWEYRRLVRHAGFHVRRTWGIFPTVPWVWRWVRRRPAQRLWMHRAMTWLLPVPGWCLCAVIECEPAAESHGDRSEAID
jgi:SAM-dependent methyltransferase